MLEKITKIKKEYWFIFFFLVGSLVFFDLVGINYSGITGAQVLDSAKIGNIAKTFEGLYRLMFEGFLAPIFTTFDKDGVLAIRLLIALFLFAVLSVTFSKTERFGKMSSVLAAVIGLAVAAFTPTDVLNAYFGTSGIGRSILGLVFILGLVGLFFYLMHRWDAQTRGGNIVKGVIYILFLFIIIYTGGVLTSLGITETGSGLNIGSGELGYTTEIALAISMLACLFLGFYHILFKGLAGAGQTVASAGQSVINQGGVTGIARNAGQTAGNLWRGRQPPAPGTPQVQQLRQNLFGQISIIAQNYDKTFRYIEKNARNLNSTLTSADITRFNNDFRAVITGLMTFQNDVNTSLQNTNPGPQILAITRTLITMFNNVINGLNNKSFSTFEQIRARLDRPSGYIAQRFKSILQYIQQIP